MSDKHKGGRPKTGTTPVRQVGRVDDATWELITRAAAINGQTITAFCVETLLRRAKRIVREHSEGDV